MCKNNKEVKKLNDKNRKKSKEKQLNAKQRKAVELQVYQGLSNVEVAKAVNVTPSTLSLWINHNELFIKILEEKTAQVERERRRRYKGAAQRAVNKLVGLLDSDNDKIALAACKDILDRAGDKPSDKVDLSGTLETANKLDSILRQLSDEE